MTVIPVQLGVAGSSAAAIAAERFDARFDDPGPCGRYLFFTNECVGLGHLRRGLTLARAVREVDPRGTSLIVTGSQFVPEGQLPPGVDTVKLPALGRDDSGNYRAWSLGMTSTSMFALRARVALATAMAFSPDVVVVDKLPLGLGEELLPVAENIAYGCAASREQIVEAAEAADAGAFIAALPHGYDEPLGPQGVGLSGGQRQRLGIARVLLRNPPILLLDEPTTGLDAASEAAVMERLDVLMDGRTTVLVTHSMALARRADRVVVLDDGRIVQDGSPADLLGQPGPFRRLAAEQGLLDAERPARERLRRGSRR